jgi:predicted ATPase
VAEGDRRPFREFGSWVRARRLARRWTQEELADRLRYDVTYVRKIEWGERKASEPFLARVAEVFELPVQSLPPPTGPRTHATSLPSPTTSFVGREADVEVVGDQLLTGTRLLTLVGAPGIGKTRLAVEVATRLDAQLANGSSFVSLVTVADADAVPAAVGASLGLPAADAEEAERLLAEHLRAQERLLVLDNFEHVLGAGPFVARLLASTPSVRVLATSREALHVGGEAQYPVPALPVDLRSPPSSASPAIALFVDRARIVSPGFALDEHNADDVGEICRRLDGVPLAVELAAGAARLMSPRELLVALDRVLELPTAGPHDAPAHQRTLRATIDWSYRLLADDEQALLARLGVFAGGFTLDAAAVVCGRPGIDRASVVTSVAGLVGKSLLETRVGIAGGTRYIPFETIREYAVAQLARRGEVEDARRRHAAWAAEWLESAAPHLTTKDQAHWLDVMTVEHPNLLAALTWAQSQQPRLALRLAGALWRYWWFRGQLADGRRRLEAALVASPADDEWRIRAVNGAGVLARTQGDYGRAVALFEEAAVLARGAGRDDELAFALASLGTVEQNQGDYDAAERLLAESLSLYRSIGDERGAGHALNGLGNVAAYRGDEAGARTYLDEALAAFRAIEDRWSIAAASANLGWVAYTAGEVGLARGWYVHSLGLFRELGDEHGVANALGNLGRVAFDEGDLTSANGYYDEALLIVTQLGERRQVAECIEGVAGVAAAQGRRPQAVRLYSAAAALRESIGAPLWPRERDTQSVALDELRHALGRPAFDEAWAEGRRLTVDDAVALALGRA